jgi:hypothetical protein
MPQQGRVNPVIDRARSFGHMKRLTVAALACGALFVPAQVASANDVTLWACHGPNGEALGVGPLVASGTTSAGCTTKSTALTDGLHASLPAGAAGAATSWWRVPISPYVTLKHVMAQRQTNGFGDGFGGQESYVARSSASNVLETAPPSLTGTLDKDATGDDVFFGVTCNVSPSANCPGQSVGVDIGAVALTVADTSAPRGSAGPWHSPVGGSFDLSVTGTDDGAGLSSAVAFVDGNPVASAALGDTTCRDLSDGGAIDIAINAGCPLHVDNVKLTVNTVGIPDGAHTLRVTLTDIAGNATNIVNDAPLEVNNTPVVQSPSQDLTIGNSGTNVVGANGGTGGTGGSGGVAGASETSCQSPKLTMLLSQKPLRVSHGVPVLRYDKRYRFRGRLTCVVNGKRKSATPRTRIDLVNTVGKRTVLKGGATVRDKGGITLILSYKSSRTLTFRYTNPDGKRSQVKIKIKVERPKKK